MVQLCVYDSLTPFHEIQRRMFLANTYRLIRPNTFLISDLKKAFIYLLLVYVSFAVESKFFPRCLPTCLERSLNYISIILINSKDMRRGL